MGETDTRRVALESRWPRALRRFSPPGGIGLAVIVALSGGLLWLGYREHAPSPAPEAPAVYSSLNRLLTLRPLAAGRPSRSAVPIEDRQPSSVLAFGFSETGIEVARATVEIERAQEESGDEPDLRVQGLVRGSEGRLDEAVLLLQGAHLEEPERADVLSDLAAVRLSRFTEAGDPEDLFEALSAAERALELEPGLPSALFNRALALSWLHTRSQATAAWEAYMAMDAAEPWAGTAREELERLRRPTLEDRWKGVRERLLAPAPRPSEQEIREAVREFPHRARMLVLQELLPRWGRAWRDGDRTGAASWLERARDIGLALERGTRDALISATIATTEEAAFTLDDAAVARQAAAYEFLGRGLDLTYQGRHGEAAPVLRRSEKLLKDSGDPLWALPGFFRASALQHSNPARSVEALLRLQRAFSEALYPQLSGFCDWVLGTIESITGDSEQALLYFRNAQLKLHQSASDYGIGPVHVLLADAHRLLGQDGAARREYLKGLEVAARVGDRYRYHVALYAVIEALLEHGKSLTAMSLAQELVANAERQGTPHFLAEAYLQRGRARSTKGLARSANEDLQRARQHVREMPNGDLRRRMASTLALAEAEFLIGRDTAQAMKLLDGALESNLRRGYLYNLTRTLNLRGMAYLDLGAAEDARRELVRAIEEYERLRSASESQELRRSSFELAQQTFDVLITLEVETASTPELTLGLAERSRSRQIADLLQHGPRDVVRNIDLPPPGLTFIEYYILPDRLLTWVASERGVSLRSQQVLREDLERQVQGLRNVISRRASEQEIQRGLAPLYNLLIAPINSELPSDTALVVVPDRFLAQVPFNALYDQERGRYLIEDYPVTLSPAIHLYPTVREGSGDIGDPRSGGPVGALVIGDPEIDRADFPDLQSLKGAREEAAEVSRLYSKSRLLLGGIATAEAFLEHAPAYNVLQFSGHARVGQNERERSGLILTSTSSRTGTLVAAEIAALDLRNTALVVLSTCSSLDADRGGRESVTGLAAAFFAAGVPTVISSLWELEDSGGRGMMLRLHKAVIEGTDPILALQAAQLELLRSRDPALRSPAAWGAFTGLGGSSALLN